METKSPAVLFYTADFLSGVSTLTMEERGQYITLLCLQHQTGHLSIKTIDLNIPKISEDVLKKFSQDKDGNYYQHRMEEETIKRNNYVDSRTSNRKGKPNKSKAGDNSHMKEHMNKHMGNGNDNKNINININIYKYIEKEFERTLTSNEVILIDEWLEKYNEEILKYAVKIATEKSKRTMAYADGILKNWKGCHYETLEDCKQDKPAKKEDEPLSQETLEIINGDFNWLEDNEEEERK